MSFGIDKAGLQSIVFWVLIALGWIPWRGFQQLFLDVEEEARKRKKDGVGLI